MPAGLADRVLVVRLGAIGDVANALIVATAIKQSHPDVQVGWAVHDLALPLVDGHPSVDRVHLWRRGGGMEGFSSFLREVRAERYGLVIDLQRIFKSALVARLSHAPRTLGFDRARAKEGSWMWTREKIPPGDPGAHMVLQYLEFVRHLGLPSYALHELPAHPEADAWAAELVDELARPPIVLNLGASKKPNRWPPERFGQLARWIVDEQGTPVCLTGGPGDAELGDAAWRTLGAEPQARNLVGATSLPQLIALLRRARLVVSCDTGAMHLAAAVGTPIVALFGPADPGRTGPWGDQHRVVRAPGIAGSMAEIGVELVRSAVHEQLLALR
ncbi:MAG: glycosyltransferase family 9 protein [Planctomycetota bacterium]